MVDETLEKSPRELAEELKKSMESNTEREAEMSGAIVGVEQKAMDEATGRDLDFDIKAFITEGSISKKNIPVIPGKTYVDMHSLSNKEMIIVAEMLREVAPSLKPETPEYEALRETIVITMAVTRVNNMEIPIVAKIASARNEVDKANYEKKKVFLNTLLDADDIMIRAFAMLYNTLSVADVLKETVRKK
jgi:hypothetical protein